VLLYNTGGRRCRATAICACCDPGAAAQDVMPQRLPDVRRRHHAQRSTHLSGDRDRVHHHDIGHGLVRHPAGVTANATAPLSGGRRARRRCRRDRPERQHRRAVRAILLGFTSDQLTNPANPGDHTDVDYASGRCSTIPTTPRGTTLFRGLATGAVTLGAGSITSVSAGGATLPYGATATRPTGLRTRP